VLCVHFSLIADILSSMSETERTALETTDLYRRSAVLKNFALHASVSQPVVMELNKIPEHQIGMCVA
jgi:hypothetical protein